jgi:protein-L-isoaspartate(D-aspartate) O-methyltransferase
MTDLLQLEPSSKVLEIGTGSGYQAAVLAELVKEVYTIEIIGALANQAAERLKRLGYTNIKTHHGDGYYGWQSAGPFDSIVVTAAADHIPPPLIQQLKAGGKMIIPSAENLRCSNWSGGKISRTSNGEPSFRYNSYR